MTTLGTFTAVTEMHLPFFKFMMPAIRTIILVFTICLLCLPATVFACGGTASAAHHDCCAKEGAKEHLCAKGQAENEQAGKECSGACSDCCSHHLTEFTVLPVVVSLKPEPHPNQARQRWAYSEEYSFTDFQLIWTPPKNSLSSAA